MDINVWPNPVEVGDPTVRICANVVAPEAIEIVPSFVPLEPELATKARNTLKNSTLPAEPPTVKVSDTWL